MERRFHSPYKHWVSGLITEVAALSAFTVLMIVLSLLIVWAAR